MGALANLAHPVGFSAAVLGVPLYDWQKAVLSDLAQPGNVALKAANGSGKTVMVVAPAVLWHASLFAGSLTVCTAGVFRQVKEQLFPAIRRFSGRLRGWVVNDTDATAPNRSRIIGFSTDDPGRFEGWHGTPERPLLMVVDEAKSVSDGIFQAIDRCQPQRRLLASSTGLMSGEFYRAFTSASTQYARHSAKAHDCPHISAEWIDAQIGKYGGEDHPFIRSMIFAEFADVDEMGRYVLSVSDLDRALASPPTFAPGDTVAFCDFAGGGDECVLAIRRGNRVTIADAWRERDTMSSVGRFVTAFRRNGLSPEEIWGDEGGLGKPMLDALAEAGWTINRLNNGSPAIDGDHYVNRGAEIWHAGAGEIVANRIIVPEDSEFRAQVTSRLSTVDSRGRRGLEAKEKMRRRGIASPDRADAVLGAIVLRPARPVETYVESSPWEELERRAQGAVLAGCNPGW